MRVQTRPKSWKCRKTLDLYFCRQVHRNAHPIERCWRELKDWLSDYEPKIMEELSELITVGLSGISKTRISSITSFEYLMSAWESAIA